MSKRTPECNICACGLHAWAPATKWGIALVDAEDSYLLRYYGWAMMNHDRLSTYAHSSRYKKATSGSGYLHRAVSDLPITQKIDHVNGNGLDCRKDNLRPVTQQQNTHNKRGSRFSTSKFKGVHFKATGRGRKRWVAQIRAMERNICIGCFATELEAARAYDAAAVKHFGTFSRINFPNNESLT